MELPKDSMNNFIILTNGSIWYLVEMLHLSTSYRANDKAGGHFWQI